MSDPYFHPLRFKEFQPELEAQTLLGKTLEKLERCRTESGARVRLHVMAAIAALPEVLKQPDARAELEQRLLGKFVEPAMAAAPPGPVDIALQRERDRNAELLARIEALEAAAARTEPAPAPSP